MSTRSVADIRSALLAAEGELAGLRQDMDAALARAAESEADRRELLTHAARDPAAAALRDELNREHDGVLRVLGELREAAGEHERAVERLRRELQEAVAARDRVLAATVAPHAKAEAEAVKALRPAVARAWAAQAGKGDYGTWLAGLLPAPTEIEVRELRELIVK